MNTREIKILLDKYFEGESTLDEEKILKEFFNSGDVPGRLKEYTKIFSYFEIEKQDKPGPGFEDKIMEKIAPGNTIPFYQSRRFWYYFTGIAASVIFIFTIFYESELSGRLGFTKYSESEYSLQQKQLAYNQTKLALGYVSGKMKQGLGPLQEMNKISAGVAPLIELGKLEKNLVRLGKNVNKIDHSVENMKKISKFTIIVKP